MSTIEHRDSERAMGGIPWERIFAKVAKAGKPDGLTVGVSARLLRYWVKSDSISVSDVKESGSFFMSSMVEGEFGDTVGFSLQTRGFDGVPDSHHPDFRARQFVELALNHFADNGFDIKKFQARWLKDEFEYNDNYQAFMDEFNRSGDKVKAARSTWSARTLGRFGFTEIGKGDVQLGWHGESVTAIFHRKNR